MERHLLARCLVPSRSYLPKEAQRNKPCAQVSCRVGQHLDPSPSIAWLWSSPLPVTTPILRHPLLMQLQFSASSFCHSACQGVAMELSLRDGSQPPPRNIIMHPSCHLAWALSLTHSLSPPGVCCALAPLRGPSSLPPNLSQFWQDTKDLGEIKR